VPGALLPRAGLVVQLKDDAVREGRGVDGQSELVVERGRVRARHHVRLAVLGAGEAHAEVGVGPRLHERADLGAVDAHRQLERLGLDLWHPHHQAQVAVRLLLQVAPAVRLRLVALLEHRDRHAQETLQHRAPVGVEQRQPLAEHLVAVAVVHRRQIERRLTYEAVGEEAPVVLDLHRELPLLELVPRHRLAEDLGLVKVHGAGLAVDPRSLHPLDWARLQVDLGHRVGQVGAGSRLQLPRLDEVHPDLACVTEHVGLRPATGGGEHLLGAGSRSGCLIMPARTFGFYVQRAVWSVEVGTPVPR
jgi:hypothetical protein